MKPANALLEPLANRIKLAINRAFVHLVSDSGKRQMLQVEPSKGEIKDNVERIQNYGFTSHPLPGSQAVMLCVGGNRDHPMVVAVDDPRYRLHNLQAGEAAIYDHTGSMLILKADGSIEAIPSNGIFKITASDSVQMDTPILKVTGQVHDLCEVQPSMMSGMRDIYNSHTHPETNTSGGDTQDPNQKMGGV